MNKKIRTTLSLVLLGALLLAGVARAAPLAVTIERHVIGGGGGRTQAGIYDLEGAAGQPVVGRVANSPYQVAAGFWAGVGAAYHANLPAVMRGYEP